MCFGGRLQGDKEEEEESLLEEEAQEEEITPQTTTTTPYNSSRKINPKLTLMRISLRTFISSLVLLVAIFFPEFEQVLGLLGSLFSLTNSVLFPLACYTSYFPFDYKYSIEDGEVEYEIRWKRILAIIGFIFFFVLCLVGTAASFLRSWILEIN